MSFDIESSNTLDATLTANKTTCGEENGTIEVNILSGNPPYEISLNGTNVTGLNYTDLSTGSYTIVIDDSDGCQWSGQTFIQDSELPSMALETMSPSCGEDNGKINIFPSGGIPSYEVNIGFGWSSILSYDNLPSGSYNVQLRDDEGCIVTEKVEFGPTSDIKYFTHLDHADCGNASGVITIIAVEGIAPMIYSISNADIYYQNTNGIFKFLEPGEYKMTVTGADGCEVGEKITLLDDPGVRADVEVNHPNCGMSNGSLNILLGQTGTAPYIVYIDAELYEDSLYNSINIDNLSNGSYEVSISDYYGCVDTVTIILDDGNTMIQDLIINDVACDGSLGSIYGLYPDSLEYTFVLEDSIINQSGEFNNLDAGVYSIYVTDSMECDISFTVNIEDFSFMEIEVDIVQTKCGNTADVYIKPQGGTAPFTYFLNEDKTHHNIIENVEAGEYEIIVVDVNGCRISETIEIKDNSNIGFEVLKCQSPKANGNGFLVVEAFGGTSPYKYQLGPFISEKGLFINLKDTKYTLTITDSDGCELAFDVMLCPNSIMDEAIYTRAEIDQHISIYPNPATNRLNIDHGYGLSGKWIEIKSTTGQLIHKIKINDENITSIDVHEFNSGVYFLSIDKNKPAKWIKI